jgi:hypothetical protein
LTEGDSLGRHALKLEVTTGRVISGPKVPLIHPKIKDEPTHMAKIEEK